MSIKGDISVSGNRPPLKPKYDGNPETYLRLFQILIDAALRGDRCPTLDQLRYVHKISTTYRLTPLCDLGWIRMEVYSGNWRIVEIMTGPHKGARTEEHPNKSLPYKTWYNPGAEQ